MKDTFIHTMGNILGDRMRKDEPLSPYTTWGVGGPADLAVYPATVDQLKKALVLCRDAGVSVFILGGGSNLLVADAGVRGVVLSLMDMDDAPAVEESSVTVGGGMRLQRLAGMAQKHGLSGLEWSAGIPGTVGGALVNNAGVLDAAMTDRLEEAVLVTRDGTETVVPRSGMETGYRNCSLKGQGVVVRARFRMTAAPASEIRERMHSHLEMRRQTQPVGRKTAGSVFKNPAGDHAGALIERCGCKGWTEGGAAVSEKHANFIVNRGDARADDIRKLMGRIREKVLQDTGVTLEPEVETVG